MHTNSRSLLDLWVENRRAPKDPERNLTARLRELSRRTDSGLVLSIARQNARSARLLPPPDTAVFRPLSPESLARVQERAAQEKAQKKERKKEGKKDVEVAEEDLPQPSSDLEEGEVLPFIYGDPPSQLFSAPLEELDPFYQAQKTFIVINKGNKIFRFNADHALYLLNPINIVRRGAIRVVTHSFFHLFMMLTILCHFAIECVPWNYHGAWRGIAELVFTVVFTLEALVKVLSRGFFIGRLTYLRDPWNWLDFLLIILVYLAMFVFGLPHVPALRMFRVLRALNSSSLKTFRGALARSVRNLAGVMLFVVFCLSFFALVGMQLFMGSLRNKCVMWPLNVTESAVDHSPDYHDSEYNSHSSHNGFQFSKEDYYFLPGHLDPLLCGNASDAGRCPEGYTCIRYGGNPNYGLTSYDNFGWAFLSMFRLMRYDFWENLFHLTIRSSGKIYLIFFAVVMPCCFYLVNLILAVIAMAYAKQNQASISRAGEEQEEYQRILAQLKKQGVKGVEKTESEVEVARSPCRQGCDRIAQMLLKWDCCGPWVGCKKWLHSVMMDPFMDLFITLCVIANTIFMALEHFPMSYRFAETLAIAHLVFTAIFAAEMILKIIAMDPYNYFRVGWNIFDSLTVMINLVELAMEFEGVDVLRLFRLLRIFRLAKVWPTFNMLIKIIRISVGFLGKVALVLLGTFITFAVVGNQMFARSYQDRVCKISQDCELPRWHMVDFFHSFLVVIRVLCGEWIEMLWDLAEVSGLFLSLLFFISLVIVGYLLVLHVFLCLLLTSFRGDYLATSKNDRNMENMQIAIRRICKGIAWLKAFINVRLLGRKPKAGSDVSGGEEGDPKKDIKMATIDSSTAPIAKAELDLENLDDVNDTDDIKKTHSPEAREPVAVAIAAEKDGPPDCFTEGCIRHCPCLRVDPTRSRGKLWWNVRKTCFTIVEHRCFKAFIITIIILSCAALAFQDIYLEQRQILKTILEYAEQVFTWVFVVEMLLKWVAYGFNRYFTSPWCWLEFIIVNISLINITAIALGFSGLGLLKATRALRVPSWFGGTRLVLNTLFGAIPHLFDVLLACTTFWLVFAIAGVGMYAGKFSYCFNHTSGEILHVSDANNRSECLEIMEYRGSEEVSWENRKVNFDNVNNGFFALLVVAAIHGWLEVMYSAADSRHVEDQPVYEANLYTKLYFVVFITGSLFTFSLFLGVFIDYYHRQKAKIRGKDLFMTEGQRRCWTVELQCKPQRPIPRPQNRVQGLVFDLVTKPLFEFVMMALVCIYMVILMTESYDQTMEMEIFQYWASLVYVLILIIECVLKLFALRTGYFTVGWNIFDFVVVIVSIAGMFLSDLIEKYFVSPTLFRLIRAIRIVAILRLARRTKAINKLLTSLMMSLPAIFNIVLLLVVIMFVYAISGMWLFPYVKQPDGTDGISDMMNFETFGNSIMIMFQITTLANWSGLLLATLSKEAPYCDPHFENPGTTVKGNCGNPLAGFIFFCSYLSICVFFGINMFIAVLLEDFKVTTKKRADPLREEDLEMFFETWEKFDPDATHYLDYSRLSDFCDKLKEPLRIPKPNNIKLITMNLPMAPGDKIHCRDILTALALDLLGDLGEMDALKSSMEEKFKMDDPSKPAAEPVTTTLQRKREEAAAGIIQRAFRKRLPKTDKTAEDAEASGKERTAAKQPMNSLDGNPAAEQDPAVQETQPLMGSEDGLPATDPPGEGLTEVVLHSTPSSAH